MRFAPSPYVTYLVRVPGYYGRCLSPVTGGAGLTVGDGRLSVLTFGLVRSKRVAFCYTDDADERDAPRAARPRRFF